MPHSLALPLRAHRAADGQWSAQACAKLNLGLRVFPARPDGFHNLETWMVPISWYDTISIETDVDSLELRVTGRSEGVPLELDKNLAGRAAKKLAHAAGIVPKARITLHKVLPPGGGLGGGSSDAAHTLVALNQAWQLNWETPRLEALAAVLGSDVPFFVTAEPRLCTSRGEVMAPLPITRSLYAVLILPSRGCPTKDVYQAFDAGHQHQPVPPPSNWPYLASASANELGELLVNDLEPGAFAVAPWLKTLRDSAADILQRRLHMTGSGSTLFVLCDSAPQADLLHAKLFLAMNATGLAGEQPTILSVRIGSPAPPPQESS